MYSKPELASDQIAPQEMPLENGSSAIPPYEVDGSDAMKPKAFELPNNQTYMVLASELPEKPGPPAVEKPLERRATSSVKDLRALPTPTRPTMTSNEIPRTGLPKEMAHPTT